MWPFVRGERPRNRLLWRKLSCPLSTPLVRPRSFILSRWTQVHSRTLGHARKLKASSSVTSIMRKKRRKRERWKRRKWLKLRFDNQRRGSERRGRRRAADSEQQRRRRWRKRTDGETRSTLCLWSVTRVNDRPCGGRVGCSLPVQGAPRADEHRARARSTVTTTSSQARLAAC